MKYFLYILLMIAVMQGCIFASKGYKYRAYQIENDLSITRVKKDTPPNGSNASRTEIYEFGIPAAVVATRDTMQLKQCLVKALRVCYSDVADDMIHHIHLDENADGTGIFLGCAFYRNHWKHSQTYDWHKGSILVMKEYNKF